MGVVVKFDMMMELVEMMVIAMMMIMEKKTMTMVLGASSPEQKELQMLMKVNEHLSQGQSSVAFPPPSPPLFSPPLFPLLSSSLLSSSILSSSLSLTHPLCIRKEHPRRRLVSSRSRAAQHDAALDREEKHRADQSERARLRKEEEQMDPQDQDVGG